MWAGVWAALTEPARGSSPGSQGLVPHCPSSSTHSQGCTGARGGSQRPLVEPLGLEPPLGHLEPASSEACLAFLSNKDTPLSDPGGPAARPLQTGGYPPPMGSACALVTPPLCSLRTHSPATSPYTYPTPHHVQPPHLCTAQRGSRRLPACAPRKTTQTRTPCDPCDP